MCVFSGLSPKANGGGEAAGVAEERGSGGVDLGTKDLAVGEEKVAEGRDMDSMVSIDKPATIGEDFALHYCYSLLAHNFIMEWIMSRFFL